MEVTGENLKKSIADFVKKDSSDISEETMLKDLVHDSFLLVELVMCLQEDFGVRIVQDDLKSVSSVGDLISVFDKKK